MPTEKYAQFEVKCLFLR